jgi:hypothetical protein
MNDLTPIPTGAVALHLPEATTLPDWLDLGRDLFGQRRQIDWMLADWAAAGVEKFGRQADFTALFEQVGAEPKQIRNAARVAVSFPPHMRAADLPFEVHAYIAQLPEDRRLETLRKASVEHWGSKRAKEAVTAHRSQAAMFEDEDPERWATLIYRAWNNASQTVREHAWELLSQSAANGFIIIDEEQISHA